MIYNVVLFSGVQQSESVTQNPFFKRKHVKVFKSNIYQYQNNPMG